jgi:hypothetical protein
MKRLKAWFHSVVVAEVEKVLASLLGGFKKAIEDHILSVFATERKKSSDEWTTAEDRLRTISLEVHNNAMMRLASEMRQKMDEELKAFEARVQHTLEACIKDDPSHWRADEETRQLDKAHQQIEK